MASTTTNMGLTVWDDLNDVFSHTELQQNWEAIDDHDHASNGGVPIPDGGLAPNSVASTNIKASAVTTNKIADGAVTSTKLASGGIAYSALPPASDAGSILVTDASGVPQYKAPASDADALLVTDGSGTPQYVEGAAEAIGLSTSDAVRRGFTGVTAEETWAGTAGTFSHMPTPHQVDDVVVPDRGDGLGIIYVLYRALWQLTGASQEASASIFLGSNQLKAVQSSGAPNVRQLGLSSSGSDYGVLATGSDGDTGDDNFSGLIATSSPGVGDTSLVTTGQIMGGSVAAGVTSTSPLYAWGVLPIEIAAGTHDVSVQFKTAATNGGTLSMKEAALMVKTESF